MKNNGIHYEISYMYIMCFDYIYPPSTFFLSYLLRVPFLFPNSLPHFHRHNLLVFVCTHTLNKGS